MPVGPIRQSPNIPINQLEEDNPQTEIVERYEQETWTSHIANKQKKMLNLNNN